jgi:tRNA-binding protein
MDKNKVQGIRMTIQFEDFQKVDIRAGTIIEAYPFPEARHPAYKLLIDFGTDLGVKKSSAQITENYEIESLKGRQVAAVVNFPPKQIGPLMSEVLVLGFPDDNNNVTLVTPDKTTPNGNRLY